MCEPIDKVLSNVFCHQSRSPYVQDVVFVIAILKWWPISELLYGLQVCMQKVLCETKNKKLPS